MRNSTKLLGTLSGIGRLMELPVLRTTGFRDFEACPHTWALKFLRPEVPQRRSRFSNIGDAAHDIIEEMLHIKWGKVVTPEIEATMTEAWGHIPDAETNALHEYIDAILNIPAVKLIGLEHEWRVDLDGVGIPLKGTMDYVCELSDGSLLIVDHKTNRGFDTMQYWQSEIQPLMYAWAARREWPQYTKIRYSLGYINHGKSHDWVTDPDEDAALEQRLRDAWADMVDYDAAGQWPMVPGDGCRWCPISTTCIEHRRAIINLSTTMQEKIAQGASNGDMLVFLTAVSKVLELRIEEAKAAVKADIDSSPDGFVVYGDKEYSVKTSFRRGAKAGDVMSAINQWLMLEDPHEALRKKVEALTDDIYSAKVGGLDKAAKVDPVLKGLIEGVIDPNAVKVQQLVSRPLSPEEVAMRAAKPGTVRVGGVSVPKALLGSHDSPRLGQGPSEKGE